MSNKYINDDIISSAIIIYLGFELTKYPDESILRVKDIMGNVFTTELEEHINKLLYDMESIEPDWTVHTLISANVWLKDEIRKIHPELSAKAIDAIAWAFSWWWK